MEMKRLRVGGLLLPSNVLMAPLAGYTCYPFRMLAYELGAGLCFTEMSSANALKIFGQGHPGAFSIPPGKSL